MAAARNAFLLVRERVGHAVNHFSRSDVGHFETDQAIDLGEEILLQSLTVNDLIIPIQRFWRRTKRPPLASRATRVTFGTTKT